MKFLATFYRHPIGVAAVASGLVALFTLIAGIGVQAATVLCSRSLDPRLMAINVPCDVPAATTFAGPLAVAFALASIAITLFLSTLVRWAGYSLLWRKFNFGAVTMGAITLVLEFFYLLFIIGVYVQAFDGSPLGGLAIFVISLVNVAVGAVWAVATGLLYIFSREVPDQR